MKKIPTLFVRDPANLRHVTEEVTPGCEWVLAGEGRATAKLDGTCVLIRDGRWYKRRELKAGAVAPEDFEQVQHDPVTGKTVGWVGVDGKDPSNKWYLAAFEHGTPPDGTYELVGPKVQGNPHGYPDHQLVPHGSIPIDALDAVARGHGLTYAAVWTYCTSGQLDHYEGVVWHHPDGRMAKIKQRDFS